MDLKSRLRDLYGRPQEDGDLRRRLERLSRTENCSVAEHLGGFWAENQSGRLVRVEKSIPVFHAHGDHSLEEIAGVSPECISLLAGLSSLSDFDREQVLFFDTETTGLAGGAGTYAFLLGAGFFEKSDFRLVQFFLPDFFSEHAFFLDFMRFITELVEHKGLRYLVTFNGKSFDLSLLENRFVLQRLENPCTPLVHLDLLHPCRLLWRGRFEDCSLQTLEREVLHYHRFSDIPSALIPVTYFNFQHWGEFGALREVLEHNRRDIISMAILLAVAAGCVASSDLNGTVAPLALARFHLRRGRLTHAAELLEKGLACGRQDDNLQLLSELVRLRRKFGEDDPALELCYEMIRGYPRPPVESFQHAAKILEHRRKDYASALDTVLKGLTFYPDSDDLHKRRARLTRRLAKK